MKIHLNQIPPEGLNLTGEEDCALGDLGSQEIRCVGPMRYSLDLGISDGSLWANGTIAQTVELACVACLEKFEHEIKVPELALHPDCTGRERLVIPHLMEKEIFPNWPPIPGSNRKGGGSAKARKWETTA